MSLLGYHMDDVGLVGVGCCAQRRALVSRSRDSRPATVRGRRGRPPVSRCVDPSGMPVFAFAVHMQDIRQHFVAYEAANHELGNKILAHVVPDA